MPPARAPGSSAPAPGDGRRRRPPAAVPATPWCTPGWSRGWRDRAAPAPLGCRRPRSSMWVAHEWRSTWGKRRPCSPARSPAGAHDEPRALSCQPSAAGVEEQRRGGPATDELEPAGGEVVADGFACSAAQRHHTLLAPLAEHPDQTVVEVDVAEVEADELADAQPARVEHLEDGPIPARARTVARHRAEQGVDLGLRQRLRNPLGYPRAADVAARIRAEQTLLETEPVERPDRGQSAGDRRLLVAPQPVVGARLLQLVDVSAHDRLVEVRDVSGHTPPAEVLRVAAQVAPVGRQRVRRQAALDPQPRVVLGEETGKLVTRVGAGRPPRLLAAEELPGQQQPDDALGVDQLAGGDRARRRAPAAPARWSSPPPPR